MFDKALKLVWLTKYLQGDNLWSVVIREKFEAVGSLPLLLHCNYHIPRSPIQLPSFYKDLLDIWKSVYANNDTDIFNMVIWNNKNILVNKKSIFDFQWDSASLVYVRQLFDDTGHIHSRSYLSQTFDINICKRKYRLYCKAVQRAVGENLYYKDLEDPGCVTDTPQVNEVAIDSVPTKAKYWYCSLFT